MRTSLFGRLQFVSIIVVLSLPLFLAAGRPTYAEEYSQNQIRTDDVNTTTLPLSMGSTPSVGEIFLKTRDVALQQNVDCTLENCIALTFDDGPNQQVTPQVLDLLKQYDARASFFVIGNRVTTHPDIIRRINKEGHDLGNHTWSHPFLNKIAPDQIIQEFNATQQVIAQTGVSAPILFRPPYGIRTPEALAKIPAPFILWNVDPQDWSKKDAQALTQHVLTASRRGSVVVMHDTSATTVEALKSILPELKKSYKLVTIRDMFDINAESRGQYFGLQ
jgi:peptidoglycan/xylan/chitin deacetylase (PgdA/CDA1 family)